MHPPPCNPGCTVSEYRTDGGTRYGHKVEHQVEERPGKYDPLNLQAFEDLFDTCTE